MNTVYNSRRAHPAFMLITGFIIAIGAGSLLLMFPISVRYGSLSYTDALFTSASAVCVTGLIVVDTGSFYTLFGQSVILLLIQLGGLGVMTVSVFLFTYIKRDMGMYQRQIIREVFSQSQRENSFHLLQVIFFFTFAVEFLGTVFLYPHFRDREEIARPLFSALFHSVSAFCNAGFSLFPDSFMSYQNCLSLNLTVSLLIIMGGLGFPVVYDLFSFLRAKTQGRREKLSLQSRAVLIFSLILIIAGALLFYILEAQGALRGSGTNGKILTSLFQSVTCRTAGFNTADISLLKESTLLMMIGLMFVGASPGSCGGGVKTTTILIAFSHISCRLRGKNQSSLFSRGISDETVRKSLMLIILYLLIISLASFIIIAVEQTASPSPGFPFLSVLFEVVSALGTVGLSTGITSELHVISEYIVILLMLIGRVGILTIAYLIIGTGAQVQKQYAEEKVMIG